MSEQVTKAIPKESYTPTTNSNSALPTSVSAGHSTTSPDATIRTIKDQLTRATTYLSLVASRGNHGFARELRARMRDIQRVLGDATSGGQLPQKYSLSLSLCVCVCHHGALLLLPYLLLKLDISPFFIIMQCT